MIKSYRDLEVWSLGMEVATRVYRLTGRFPAEERFGLTNQLRRASVSIPSNIAEGHARQHRKEFVQFLHVSLGSLAEIETQLELAVRFGYGRDENLDRTVKLLGRKLGAFIQSVRNYKRPATQNQRHG